MKYGKVQEFDNPTIQDFETSATEQEKRLWEDHLKSHPTKFQRSVMAETENFLFVCPEANLVVELEKFRKFSDSALGVAGKKGDMLRDMGLRHVAYTNKEVDTDFDNVCRAIDRAVERQISQKSAVEIKKPTKLSLDDDEVPKWKYSQKSKEDAPQKGWKVTISGEYKDDEPVGRQSPGASEDILRGYTGNGPVKNPLKEEVHLKDLRETDSSEAIDGQEKPKGYQPKKAIQKKNLFIAPSADIVGKVYLGDNVSVWYQAVLRGDEEPITIGDNSNIQDGVVVHVSEGQETIIGKGVTIGHQCIIHACTIGDDTLIGMGSIVLDGAKIGKNCIVGAGSLVTQHKEFPDGYMIFGSPAKAIRPLTEAEIQGIIENGKGYVDLIAQERGRGFYEDSDGAIVLR